MTITRVRTTERSFDWPSLLSNPFWRKLHKRILLFLQNQVGGYQYSYSVQDSYTRNNFGHTENRHADTTSGQYHVLLPDGRVQTVEYSVDPYSGFVAKVVYDGKPSGYAAPPPPKTSSSYLPSPSYAKPNYVPAPHPHQPVLYHPPPAPVAPPPPYPTYHSPQPAPSPPSYSAPLFRKSTYVPGLVNN